jgi:hypothetical protein
MLMSMQSPRPISDAGRAPSAPGERHRRRPQIRGRQGRQRRLAIVADVQAHDARVRFARKVVRGLVAVRTVCPNALIEQ